MSPKGRHPLAVALTHQKRESQYLNTLQDPASLFTFPDCPCAKSLQMGLALVWHLEAGFWEFPPPLQPWMLHCAYEQCGWCSFWELEGSPLSAPSADPGDAEFLLSFPVGTPAPPVVLACHWGKKSDLWPHRGRMLGFLWTWLHLPFSLLILLYVKILPEMTAWAGLAMACSWAIARARELLVQFDCLICENCSNSDPSEVYTLH